MSQTGPLLSRILLFCSTFILWGLSPSVIHAQQGTDPPAALETGADASQSTQAEPEDSPAVTTHETAEPSLAAKWDRLIYVPFRELQKVFDNQEASVVIPYAEYMDLVQKYLASQQMTNGWSPDAVITSSDYAASVDKDIVRINAQFKINVIKNTGWASIPLTFGSVATGKVQPDDGSVMLKGAGQGRYELLVKGAGLKTVGIELLATVRTSPENKSFSMQCPPAGISELTVTIPEVDQSIQISPLQVLLPADAQPEGQSVTRASLGSVDQFEVRWNPRAGTKPVMDLLTSANTQSAVRIETGLLQTKTNIEYEILRGELREVSVAAPIDARVIDVVSSSGRIKSWSSHQVADSYQRILVELLSPATDRFQLEIQTERNPDSDTFQLVGKSTDGKLHGVHAENVVREAGRIVVTTDSALTTITKSQAGVKRVDAGSDSGKELAESGQQAWEFSGTTGQLILQVKPVEPRLLAVQSTRLIFDDSELRLATDIVYTVERAGVFQLQLAFPESLVIDTVRADGMSEFNVDKNAGQLTLSLTQKRMGKITVDITAHQTFNATAENQETELPTVTPIGVERETGGLVVYAPQFVDVMTVDEKLVGLFTASSNDAPAIGRAVRVSSWNYSRRPIALFVKTTPRPAQLSASVATTVQVEPEIIKQNSVVSFDIQNAGLDTLRIAVPEAIASDVRFQAVGNRHTIQQRNRAEKADNGWVAWTLVLQSETTGTVRIRVDWETKTAAAAANTQQSLTVQPPRVLTPFETNDQDKRPVTLTQVRGEIRLLRHESLSIAASAPDEASAPGEAGDQNEAGDQAATVEAIDVRELQLMEADGYLAYRYFSQPAETTVSIRKHEIHEVVATVVSRSLIEIVAEKQDMAAFRCRYRIITS